jgi:glucarate dehydratase
VVVVDTEDGLRGLGETYGDASHVYRLRQVAERITGLDVFDMAGLRRHVQMAMREDSRRGGDGMSGMVTASDTVARVFAPFEVACLDAQGRLVGRPVHDLLGGRVRDEIQFSGYLFYKWAGFPDERPDDWGEALTPEGLVAQAQRMVETWGFASLKLKGGVMEPADEIAATLALREAFPDVPLRLDPNGAWTVSTACGVAEELDGVVEYLEDPTVGLAGLAEVQGSTALPLATNMYVVSFAHFPEAIQRRSVEIVLSDHHFWGGLRASMDLGRICEVFGIGLSMHSNSHLGISLAAMVQVAAATERLTYACDTHWPWKEPEDDVVDAQEIYPIQDGRIVVPTSPGLGVELDEDALARMHETYQTCGYTERDDTGYMRSVQPDFDPRIPRW